MAGPVLLFVKCILSVLHLSIWCRNSPVHPLRARTENKTCSFGVDWLYPIKPWHLCKSYSFCFHCLWAPQYNSHWCKGWVQSLPYLKPWRGCPSVPVHTLCITRLVCVPAMWEWSMDVLVRSQRLPLCRSPLAPGLESCRQLSHVDKPQIWTHSSCQQVGHLSGLIRSDKGAQGRGSQTYPCILKSQRSQRCLMLISGEWDNFCFASPPLNDTQW